MKLNKLNGWQRLALVLSVIYWSGAIALSGSRNVMPGPNFWETPWPPDVTAAAAKSWTIEPPDITAPPKTDPPLPADQRPRAEVPFGPPHQPTVDEILGPDIHRKPTAAEAFAPAPKLVPVDYDPFARHVDLAGFGLGVLLAAAIYAAMAGLIWAGLGFRRPSNAPNA